MFHHRWRKTMTTTNKSTLEKGEFNSKRILVTGGTKGVGNAIADRFLQGGGTVLVTARSAPEEKTESYFIHLINTKKVAALRLNPCIRRRQSRPDELQQGRPYQ
jgi:NAD(P)-dependent dehydrogenase (short-subunit alcohol dehydrogenase family)